MVKSFEEGFCDMLVAEHEREHETVRDGKIFERDVVCLHFSPLFVLCCATFAKQKRAVPILI